MNNVTEAAPTISKESSARKTLKRLRFIDSEYIGEEPTFDSLKSNLDLTFEFCKIFNWYNHTCDRVKSKNWIIDYLKKYKEDIVSADAVQASSISFPLTVGWLARQVLLGANIPKHHQDYLDQHIKILIESGQKSLEKSTVRIQKLKDGKNQVQKNIEQKIKRVTDDCIMEFEHQIDVFIKQDFKNNFDFSKHLTEEKIIKEQIDLIAEHFAKSHGKELQQIVKGDKELREYYSNFSDEQVKALYDFVKTIIKACLSHKDVAKTFSQYRNANRKPRKKKIKSPTEQVKRLVYLQEFAELALKSIHPTKIVGAEQVWIYNTKTRKLGVYVACDSAGLGVKGSTIQNFLHDQSVEKTLRKPQEILKGVLEDGKVALRRVIPNIRSKQKFLNGRLNKNIIILRYL